MNPEIMGIIDQVAKELEEKSRETLREPYDIRKVEYGFIVRAMPIFPNDPYMVPYVVFELTPCGSVSHSCDDVDCVRRTLMEIFTLRENATVFGCPCGDELKEIRRLLSEIKSLLEVKASE